MGLFLRRQSAQPVHAESAQSAEAEPGRLGRSLRAGRQSGSGQGSQLAARTEGRLRADATAVLAELDAAVDHRRLVETPGGHAGVTPTATVRVLPQTRR